MSRTVFRCKACRHSVLDAFASFHGVSIPLRPRCIPTASLPSQTRIPQQKRLYIPSTPLQVPVIENAESPTEVAYNSNLPPSDSAPPTQVPNSIPWYLRIPEPTPPTPISPILALQVTPPLPSNPPSILQPMLDRLSTDIGLDYLSILDLRTLHPPPALGANLIMIVGTARSVKHLNVSADRFCRWLRTEWGLRPYADGLLGRNELKLKLRRKARREKMMGLVGAREVVNADYGITTGWVCVNVGMVDEDLKPKPKSDERDTLQVLDPDRDLFDIEAGEYQNPTIDDSEAEQAPEQHDTNDTNDDGYIGFGSRVTSPRIVVQMFTEEKRLEMDLEGLWEHRNTKREKTAGRRQDEVEERVAGTKKDKISTKPLQLTDADGEESNDVNEVWMHSTSRTGSPRRSSGSGTWARKQNEAGQGKRRQEGYRRKSEPPHQQANQVTGQRVTRDENISLFG